MKTKNTIALSLCVLVLISCQSGPAGPSQSNKKVAIKGTFAGVSAVLAKRSVSALDPSLVTRVAVFSGIDGYSISNVTGGSFNVFADAGKPAALVFIDSAGKNLGYLSLGNGMESIPLNMADTGVTSIDLQTLVSSGKIIEPGHNPIGTDIVMTASDITSYVFSNGALGAVVKWPDIDGDGIVDVAAGTLYRYTMRYDLDAGNFGSNQTPALANPIAINSYVLEIKISDPNPDFPSEISFSGPAGSGLESATSWLKQSFGSDGYSYCAPPVHTPSTPPAGTYVVTYKTKTLTFNLLSQDKITKYLAIPVPTVLTNGDGTINKITWEYRLSDGSATIDPKALIVDINLQISVTVPNQVQSVQVYSSPNLSPETTEHVLTNQLIQWSSVTGMMMSYHDVFGNQIQVKWARP